MLTASSDLADKVVAIPVLGRKEVRRLERARRSVVQADEGLPPPLSVGPAWRAACGFDEDVVTTFQIPRHGEHIGRPLTRGVVALAGFRISADPRYLRRPRSEERELRVSSGSQALLMGLRVRAGRSRAVRAASGTQGERSPRAECEESGVPEHGSRRIWRGHL